MDHYERCHELIDEAYRLPDGEAQISLAEEAVRLSDMVEDLELQVDARELLVHAAQFGGYAEKSIVAFSWLLARYDEDEDSVDPYDLMWKYKWIADDLTTFVAISRERIEASFEDMSARMMALGFDMKPVYGIRCEASIAMGDLDEAAKWYDKWLRAPSGAISDCEACTENSKVSHALNLDGLAAALEHFGALMRRELSCNSVPHSTHSLLMRPLLCAGRLEEAVEHHRKGWELVREDGSQQWTHFRHMSFLALTHNFARALRQLERFADYGYKSREDSTRMFWFQEASITLRALADAQSEAHAIILPQGFPGWREDGRYDVGELADLCASEARKIAKLFDQRNGNDYVSTRLEKELGSVKFAQAHPIT